MAPANVVVTGHLGGKGRRGGLPEVSLSRDTKNNTLYFPLGRALRHLAYTRRLVFCGVCKR